MIKRGTVTSMENNCYRFGSMLKFDLFSASPSDTSKELCDAFGGKNALLEFCGKELDTVELHMIKSDSSPTMVLNAVKELKSYGLEATLHGTLSEKDEFFLPYSLIFNSNLQPFYNITVHPANTKSETERMLRDICDEIEEKKYPAFITLENQRMKNEN